MLQNVEKTAKKISDFFKVKVKFDDLENVTEKSAMSICSKKVIEAFFVNMMVPDLFHFVCDFYQVGPL